MGAIFGFTGPRDPNLLRRMSQVLAHRGSEAETGDEGLQGTLGYRARFEEPVRRGLGSGLFVDGDQAMAIAGYVLQEDGRRTQPAELLRLYRDHGPAFVSHLRGQFVLAVRDGGTIHLARDGAGVRTVYYGRHEGRFLFAVEPKGILAAPGFPRRIRPAAVAQYLTFSYTPGAAKMLKGLYELPPGHYVSCDGCSEPKTHRYFFFEQTEEDGQMPDERWVECFTEEFGRAVTERLPRGEPVGIFLSGGIDSSVVVAEVARRHAMPVKTYAIHFGKEYPNELEFARAVAERCGTQHEEILIRPSDFLPRIRKIIWHLDEPIGDPITIPNFELAARVARDVRWVFNGEGGDPVFGGPKNIPMLLQHWYGGIQRGERFREQWYLASYRRAYQDIDRLLTGEWRRRCDARADLEGIVRPFFETDRPKRFLNKLMAMNIRLKGAHLILPKVDRMTGAWGLFALSPLFDERLIRMSFEMPARLKVSRGVEKIVLKRAYADGLPPEVIARPKSGMRVPVHFWFKGEMKRYARKILNAKSLRQAGIFDERRVKQLLDYDLDEAKGRCGLKLWMLITFEIWRRIVVEGEAL